MKPRFSRVLAGLGISALVVLGAAAPARAVYTEPDPALWEAWGVTFPFPADLAAGYFDATKGLVDYSDVSAPSPFVMGAAATRVTDPGYSDTGVVGAFHGLPDEQYRKWYGSDLAAVSDADGSTVDVRFRVDAGGGDILSLSPDGSGPAPSLRVTTTATTAGSARLAVIAELGGAQVEVAAKAVSLTAWHELFIDFTGTSFATYVDGQLVKTYTPAAGVVFAATPPTELVVGALSLRPGYGSLFTGRIGAVEINRQAYSAAQLDKWLVEKNPALDTAAPLIKFHNPDGWTKSAQVGVPTDTFSGADIEVRDDGWWNEPFVEVVDPAGKAVSVGEGADWSVWTPLRGGIHTVRVVSIDEAGHRGQQEVQVTVPNAPLPNVGTVAISGTAKAGLTVSAKPAGWPAGVSYLYQWYSNGVAISGATKATLVVPGTAVGKPLVVKVRATKPGFITSAQVASAAVTPAVGTLTGAVPTISGTVAVGKVVTAVPGTWTSGTTLRYQWFANGAGISGATAAKLTVPAAAVGKALTVRVIGSQTGFTSLARTSAATTVAKGTLTAPVPTISDTTPVVGQTLTAKPGTWTTGTTLKYQWYANGVAITNAAGSTYTVGSGMKGRTLTVKVTGSKAGYTTVTRTSAATAAVG